MTKIAIITSGLNGILNSSFEMVRQFTSEGYEVICMSPSDVEKRVLEQGFSFIQLPTIQFDFMSGAPEYKGALRIFKRILYRHWHKKKALSEGIKALNFHGFVRILKKSKIDVAIIDIELHEIILAAWSIKLPLIILSQWFSNYSNAQLPPITSSIIPAKQWTKIDRRMWAARTFYALNFKLSIWIQWLLGYTKRRDVIRHFASNIGISKNAMLASYFPPDFQYKNIPVWSINQWELEFPHKPQKNVSYVGPKVNTKRKDLINNEGVHKQLQTIIECKKQDGNKLIYCSISTFKKGDTKFIKNVINAVRDVPDWELVVSLGGNISIHDYSDIPGNCHIFDWVPQLSILSEADCNINHGGIHTINECLHFSIPMLIYSGKRFDQNGCAARVHYHGIGIMGDKDVDGPTEIRQKLNSILSDPLYKKRIVDLNTHYLKQIEKKSIFIGLQKVLNSDKTYATYS